MRRPLEAQLRGCIPLRHHIAECRTFLKGGVNRPPLRLNVGPSVQKHPSERPPARPDSLTAQDAHFGLLSSPSAPRYEAQPHNGPERVPHHDNCDEDKQYPDDAASPLSAGVRDRAVQHNFLPPI